MFDLTLLGLGAGMQKAIKVFGIVLVMIGLLGAILSLVFPRFARITSALFRRFVQGIRRIIAGVVRWAIETQSEGAGRLIFPSGTKYDQFWDGNADEWIAAKRYHPIHPLWGNIEGATWIWLRQCVTDEEAKTGGSVYLRRTFTVPFEPRRVIMKILVDDYAKVNVNGREVAEVLGCMQPQSLDLLPYMIVGGNEITMEVINVPGGPQATSSTNPTGVMYRIDV
ncbi:MAG: hypothetical protein WBH57_09305 [Anaerolineae bacterium]